MTFRSRTTIKRKKRTRRKRRSILRPSNLFRLGIIGTLLYFVLSLGAGIFLAEHAIRPEREPLNPINSEPLWNFARRLGATLSDAEIERPGNVTLHGWGIRPPNANAGSVLLLHGLSESRTAVSGVAEFLLAAGYSVLMPDARAHGESGGDVATYGLLEAGDIRAWVDWIQNSQHPECVFALGESMGAAQLLEVSLKRRASVPLPPSPHSPTFARPPMITSANLSTCNLGLDGAFSARLSNLGFCSPGCATVLT